MANRRLFKAYVLREQLGDTLVNHFDGTAAYCDHPVEPLFIGDRTRSQFGPMSELHGIVDDEEADELANTL